MTDADFEPFKVQCGGEPLRYRRTLRETSKTNDGRYCLERGYASEIAVLRFEDLVNDWMDVAGRCVRNEPCPSTVDALYVDGDSWYLIEFKRNETKALNQMKSKLMYKAYDSILQLVEHGLRTVAQVRTHDSYILEYCTLQDCVDLNSRAVQPVCPRKQLAVNFRQRKEPLK